MPLPAATTVDIIPYTTINHEAQKMLGISNDEYCVANAIHNLSHNPKSSIPGWCFARKEYIAAAVNVSRASVFRYIHRLVLLGIVELHPERTDLMRTTAKWYDSTLMKKVEVIVEDMPIETVKSQNETKVSEKENTDNLKLRQESQTEKSQSQSETDESQIETDIYTRKAIQGNSTEINTSSNEEVEQMADEVIEEQDVVVDEPNSGSGKSSLLPNQNPDGSFGNADLNEGMNVLAELLDHNPTKAKLNRIALGWLYKTYTKERTLKAIRLAFKIRGHRYAPSIYNYMDLKDKWGNLEDFARRYKRG